MTIQAQLISLLREREELRSTNIINLPHGEQLVLTGLLRRVECKILAITGAE